MAFIKGGCFKMGNTFDGMHHRNGEEWEQKVDVYWDNTGFLQADRQPVVGVRNISTAGVMEGLRVI